MPTWAGVLMQYPKAIIWPPRRTGSRDDPEGTIVDGGGAGQLEVPIFQALGYSVHGSLVLAGGNVGNS
jgi:hypothetical protein